MSNIVRFIHFAGEHATEFQIRNLLLILIQICNQAVEGLLITLFHRHFDQVHGVSQATGQARDGFNDSFQLRTLAPQLLGFIGRVPNSRIF